MLTNNKKAIFDFLDEEYDWLKYEPYLNEKAEKRLLKSAINGDTASRDQIIKSWFHLALFEAGKRCNNISYFPDMVNYGMLGLIQALEKFDYERGNRFSTYAIWWVRQCVIRNLPKEIFLIKLPDYIWSQADKRSKYCQNRVSFDNIEIYQEDSLNFYEINDIYHYVIACIESLSHREQYIIKGRMHGQTLEKLGDDLGITRERVRQIEKQGKDSLKKKIKFDPSIWQFLEKQSDTTIKYEIDRYYNFENSTDYRSEEDYTIFPYVRAWVFKTGSTRPLMTFKEITKKQDENEFHNFFKSYEYEKELSPIEDEIKLNGNYRILTEKIIEAVGLKRLWRVQWNGSICDVVLQCGMLFKVHLELMEGYLILSSRICKCQNCDHIVKDLYIKPGYYIKNEIIEMKKVYSVCGKISNRVSSGVLSKVIQDIIYQINICNIQIGALGSFYS